MTVIAFAILAVFSALVSIISMYLYTRKLTAQMQSLQHDYLLLKSDNQFLKNQYNVLHDQYLSLLEKFIDKAKQV
jgi:cell division protein FtsB